MLRTSTNFTPYRRAFAPIAIALALVTQTACGPRDPYEVQMTADAKTYARAVTQLETDEKLLVNRFKARMDQERVEPVGVTIREALETQRAHEQQLARAVEAEAAAPALPGGGLQLAPALISTLIGSLDPGPGGGLGANQFKREFKWSWSSGGAPSAPLVPGPKVISPPPAPEPDDDAGAPAAGPKVTSPPPAPEPDDDAAGAAREADATAPTRMTAEMLRRLHSAVAEQRMQGDKLRLLLGAIPQHTFDTEQAAVLIDLLFQQRRVEALAAFYPQLVDPENFDALAQKLLIFPDDLESLERRLRTLEIKPTSAAKAP